jgi:glutamate-1-semialdehyde 2,1-aminomutase
MIVEPAMMNCGVILPEPGYLQGIKDLLHKHGAYLTFDEVKTGATLAYGGAIESFGVTPDIICLAKAIGGGVPCGAIGATRELFQIVVDDEYDMAGTFNGNPLTMAASRACLTEVLTREVYPQLNAIHHYLEENLTKVIEQHRIPAYVTGLGAKGSVIYSEKPVKEYRDTVGIDERISYLAWLFQQNRGVFKSPWSKQETWTLSIDHTEEDAARYVANFEEFATAISR